MRTPPRGPIGHETTCTSCGAPIVLVPINPVIPRRRLRGRRIPLDPGCPPDDVAPSHALSTGRRECRPLTASDPIAPGEHPALTHFATCPARPRSAPEEDR